MRYSKQRELVLHTVEQLCDHPTAEEIFDKAAPECGEQIYEQGCH